MANICGNEREEKKLHGKFELIEQRRLQFVVKKREERASGSGKYLIKKEIKKQ